MSLRKKIQPLDSKFEFAVGMANWCSYGLWTLCCKHNHWCCSNS